jgi:DSBA-like thioredoxin domain-containing protein
MTSDLGPPRYVVYGDFNCPFSALASARATVLERGRRAAFDWRAVEHDPTIPVDGEVLTDDLRAELAEELTHVRGLLLEGEPDDLQLNARRPNTHGVTLAYAAATQDRRPALRARLFTAYWRLGHDIGAPGFAATLGASEIDEVTAARWRSEWQALPKPIVPEMVLPDGQVMRGIHALEHLAVLLRQPVGGLAE